MPILLMMSCPKCFMSLVVLLCVFGVHESMADQPDADAERTLPPIDVRPPAGEPPPDFDQPSFDLPFSYPSLTDQTFDSLSGGLRASRSVFDDPRNVTIVGPLQLQEIAPIDMGQALEREPSVTVQRTGRGQSSPFIRGLTGQQVLILVDGVRLSNATFRAGPNQYFNQIDPNMVERVEVIRGPQSVQWGSDAIGGVVNIVTKRAEFTGCNYLTGGTIQQFSTADAGYQGRVNVEGWVGSTGVFARGGYGNFNNVDRGGGLGRQPATSFNQYSGDVKLSYTIDDCSEILVALQHFEQNDLFRTDRFEKGDERIFDPQQRDLVYLRLNHHGLCSFVDTGSFTVSYNRMKESQIRHDDNLGAYTSESQRQFINNQFGVNLVFASDLCCLGTLTYGVDWYHEHIDSSRTDLTVVPPTSRVRAGPFPDDAFYTRFGAFLEWDFDLTERLTAISGVRYSYIKAGADVTVGNLTGYIDPTYDDVSASVGLTYELNPCWHVVGSVAEGFRAPNLDDFAATNDDTFAGTQIPNPTLRPERSMNYEIGLKTDADRFRTQTFFFYTDIRDHILRQPRGNPLAPTFILERENRNSRLYGVELAGEYLLNCGFSAYGNFSYVYGQDTDANEPLSRVNPTQGTAGLRWRDECGENWVDVFVWMVDRQDRLSARDLADTVRIPAAGTPGYATLNFRCGRMIGQRQRISLNVMNITDKAYRVHGSGADGPGIDVMLGYEWLR